jgi:hypothetical protein
MKCPWLIYKAVLRIHDILGWIRIRIRILDPDPANWGAGQK